MRRAVFAMTVLMLVGSSCARRSSAALTLSGSTSLQPLAEKWAEAYQAQHPELTLGVQGGGSTAGVEAAISGTAQIGMVSRRLTLDEQSKVREIVVARDAIAVVVHPLNQLNDVSLDDLRRLYSGKVTSWRQLGGSRSPVTLITREEGSGTRAAFEALVMRGTVIAAGALVQDSTGAVRQMVRGDPAAVGFISLGLVDESVKVLGINGVRPTEASVDADLYALTRPFAFAVRGEPPPHAAKFIAWIHGADGVALTRSEGFLPAKRGEPHAER